MLGSTGSLPTAGGRTARPRRVVVLASYAPSLVRFRGSLLRAMAECGHRVLAVAPENDPEIAATLTGMGVAFRTVPMARASLSPWADLLTLGRFARLLQAARPDIMLAYTMKPIIYGGLAGRLVGVPLRYPMIAGLGHVFTDDNEVTGLRRRLLQAACSRLYRAAMHGAEAVFVFNPDDENEIRSRRMVSSGQRVLRVPGSGIDLAAFAQVPLPPGPPVFLMIARLLRAKGLFDYVEAARRLRPRYPAIKVQVLGPLDPSPSGIDRHQVARWEREGVVDYLGETRDVRPYLAKCSVFVLPSYYREGIPRSVLEAMATGRPIITTDSPGCRETVVDGENGLLVPVRDPEALAAAMARFCADPTLAPVMGQRAREMAEARFDVRIVNQTLLATMGLA